MPLTNQNNVGFIQEYTGNLFAIREVNDDSSPIAGKLWVDLPDAEKFDIKSERKAKKVYNAKGDMKKAIYGERDVEIKLTSLESNAGLLNFMLTETVGKYYAFCGWMGTDDDNGNTKQWVYSPVCQIEPSVTISMPGRKPVVTLSPIVPKLAWNANTLSLSAGSVSAWVPNPGTTTLTASLSGVANGEPILFGAV